MYGCVYRWKFVVEERQSILPMNFYSVIFVYIFSIINKIFVQCINLNNSLNWENQIKVSISTPVVISPFVVPTSRKNFSIDTQGSFLWVEISLFSGRGVPVELLGGKTRRSTDHIVDVSTLNVQLFSSCPPYSQKWKFCDVIEGLFFLPGIHSN